MVGGGLSRCAVKARPDAGDAPLWHDLATEITKRLYPRHDSEDQPGEPGDKPTTGDLLSLAQEYEIAFGRTDLHRFLQQQIRDGDFTPGGVHEQLMRLPWRDVFTTNWDTLLERTGPQVVDRSYNTVVDMDQIPLANRPRIVKLHGSLPAQFPLIFAEEDYRTYPTEFAPFVNTVQQAMMETVFCLIGFSGNDPNFLHWSGWVRDNLGASAPKIYLGGLARPIDSHTPDAGKPWRRAHRSCTSPCKPMIGPNTCATATQPSGCCIRWSEDAPMMSQLALAPHRVEFDGA